MTEPGEHRLEVGQNLGEPLPTYSICMTGKRWRTDVSAPSGTLATHAAWYAAPVVPVTTWDLWLGDIDYMQHGAGGVRVDSHRRDGVSGRRATGAQDGAGRPPGGLLWVRRLARVAGERE